MFMYILSILLALSSVPGAVNGSSQHIDSTKVKITADGETDPVEGWFDAADDPAIWVHPTDINKSRIIGTDKKWGLFVYKLNGKKVGAYRVGKINNVDLRYDFSLAGEKIDIVGGTNRSDNTIVLYSITEYGQLSSITGNPIKPNMKEVYGFAFYHSLKTGKYYALVVGKQGEFEQYELYDNGYGKINGKKVRGFHLGSQGEGVVADDELGHMYISEENVGIWKYSAEPGNSSRTQVDNVNSGRLKAEIEGVTIYYASNGKGYLIISSQGDNHFAIYEREGNNKYIGRFKIDGGKVDGVSDCDGVDVLSFGLGPEYPYGLFVVQDGFNTDGIFIRNQNFKLVSWKKMADRFSLITDTSVDPRKLRYLGK